MTHGVWQTASDTDMHSGWTAILLDFKSAHGPRCRMSCERRMRYELQTFENASRAAAMVYSKAGVSEFACNVREKP